MTTVRIVDYGCDICGAAITVSGDGSGYISPIYCCGVLVSTKDIRQEGKAAPAASKMKPAKKQSPAAKKAKPLKKTIAKKKTQPKKKSR